MSSGIGWVETEGMEGNAKETGIPGAGGNRDGSQSRHRSEEVSVMGMEQRAAGREMREDHERGREDRC
jgi:hypothetical protein